MEKETMNIALFVISCILTLEGLRRYDDFDNDYWHIFCNSLFLAGLFLSIKYSEVLGI